MLKLLVFLINLDVIFALGNVCLEGESKSPIDIKGSDEYGVFEPIKLSESYKQLNSYYVSNNDRTVSVTLQVNKTSDYELSETGLTGKYIFSKLEFHWGPNRSVGSEHTIKGKRFPFEMYMIHYSKQYGSLSEALKSEDSQAIAIFSILFYISKNDNELLSPVIESLNIVKQPNGVKQGIGKINISPFVSSVKDFYRYNGSLTSGNCEEGIVYSILRDPLPISQKQLEAFRTLKGSNGGQLVDNSKGLQPLNGRKIVRLFNHYTFDLGIKLNF